MKADAACLKERDEHFMGRCGGTYALIVICSQKQKKKRKKEIVFLYCFNLIFIKQYTTVKEEIPIYRVRHSWRVNSHCDYISIFQLEGFYSTSAHDIKGFQSAYKSVHKFPLSSPDKAQSLLVSSSDVADWS